MLSSPDRSRDGGVVSVSGIDTTRHTYNRSPCYLPSGRVVHGWREAVADLPAGAFVLALDGPAIAPWRVAIDHLTDALAERGPILRCSLFEHFHRFEKVQRLTSWPGLNDDSDFVRLATCELGELLDLAPTMHGSSTPTVIYGPGAALVEHDVLWYLDLPKRFAEAAIGAGAGCNLGQPEDEGPGTTRRLFYIDWPILDRHRDQIASEIDRFVDGRDIDNPASISGPDLRASLSRLVQRPFRTQPTFNTAPWGGTWAQQELGHNPTAPNTALGYELIAPESGVLLGDDPSHAVEVPFNLVVALQPEALLGKHVAALFGPSFPIRFDYLDTFGGGHLSVHCHPQSNYMWDVFGWPYTQHETYYVLHAGDSTKIFLGLVENIDVEEFRDKAHRADRDGAAFDIERYIQTFPATPGQLFMVPAGTPHGSGAGNVILEISATPYLYSLRFYDWLRSDEDGRQRPVHVDHAFNNLDTRRTGAQVGERLIQAPRQARSGPGWCEELLGSLPECFFEIYRLELEPGAGLMENNRDRFHVLNMVDGELVNIMLVGGYVHQLRRAETILIPAACGSYRIDNAGHGTARIVKAFVR